jgi:hypothetical protein
MSDLMVGKRMCINQAAFAPGPEDGASCSLFAYVGGALIR